MCGNPFPWSWFILDVAYVMVLLGGMLVLRAKNSLPVTWVLFGMLATGVGTFLFTFTFAAQAAYGEAVAAASETAALMTC